MPPEQMRATLLILTLTLISGWGDAQGFVHASGIWDGARMNPNQLLRSALAFSVGIGSYWLSLRFLAELGIVSPTVQILF